MWRIYRHWLEQHGLEESIVLMHASLTGILAAVKSGSGIAALPCFVADAEPDLIRCMPAPENVDRGVWLLTHERLRHEPRVRVVMDFLGDALSRLARLQGRE